MTRTAAATRVNQLRGRTLRELASEPTAAAARARCAEHIDAPHTGLITLEVRRLLLACRGVGIWHARKMLRRAQVDGGRRLGELTDRERRALADAVREPWPYETREPAPAMS